MQMDSLSKAFVAILLKIKKLCCQQMMTQKLYHWEHTNGTLLTMAPFLYKWNGNMVPFSCKWHKFLVHVHD